MPSDDRRTPMERAIDKRLTDLNSQNYEAETKRILGLFKRYAERKHGVTAPGDVDGDLCRQFARALRRATDGDASPLDAATAEPDDDLQGIQASSALRYYAYVRSFLGWCVDEALADTNPARLNKATAPLPEDTADPDRQFWPSEVRERFLSHMDAHADERIETTEPGDGERLQALRDRALVYVVALSGARGAELFRDPGDDKRAGLTWGDVDCDRGIMWVFGKTREREEVSLPGPAAKRLARYRDRLGPATDDWPVWPTFHPPALYGAVRDALGDNDVPESERERLLDDADPWDVAFEHGLALPNISIQTAREVVRDHSQTAGLTGSDGDALKLHGARRGLGSELYADDAELAQETLRHQSVETTHDAYREQQAAERGDRIEDSLYGDE